jgi:hypothetical protein
MNSAEYFRAAKAANLRATSCYFPMDPTGNDPIAPALRNEVATNVNLGAVIGSATSKVEEGVKELGGTLPINSSVAEDVKEQVESSVKDVGKTLQGQSPLDGIPSNVESSIQKLPGTDVLTDGTSDVGSGVQHVTGGVPQIPAIGNLLSDVPHGHPYTPPRGIGGLLEGMKHLGEDEMSASGTSV